MNWGMDFNGGIEKKHYPRESKNPPPPYIHMHQEHYPTFQYFTRPPLARGTPKRSILHLILRIDHNNSDSPIKNHPSIDENETQHIALSRKEERLTEKRVACQSYSMHYKNTPNVQTSSWGRIAPGFQRMNWGMDFWVVAIPRTWPNI